MEIQNKPIGPKERIEILDIIRGVALLGVLIANMLAFKAPMFNYTPPLSSIVATTDSLAAWFIKLFVEGKFYTIFSFLFGLGFYIFMERAAEKTEDITFLFRRRLLILLCIGLVHLVLLWTGDVLLTYALAGFILVKKWKMELPKLKKSIIAYLILATFILGIIYLLNGLFLKGVDYNYYIQDKLYQREMIISFFQKASFFELLKYRLSREVISALINNLFVIPNVMALFLMGLYVGKSQIHKNLYQHILIIKKVWRLTLLFGSCLTVILFLLMKLEETSNLIAILALKEIIKYYAGIIVCFFYITSMILIGGNQRGLKLIKPFAYVGRMALTNYLLQTITCVILFYGYGFGYFGSVGYGKGFIISIAIFIMQIIFSRMWLSNYTYGPMEWLWRRLTYGNQIRNERLKN